MIDWTRVLELRNEIGAEDFDEVVDLFLTEVDAAIAALLDSAPIASTRAEQMHFLKGAALNLGFSHLSDLCHTGEIAAKTGDVSAVQPGEINLVYSASKADFLSLLPSKIAA